MAVLRAVSISLGSSGRDRRIETTLLGTPVLLERIGVDGNLEKARRTFLELDDQVDAFGVGGADLGVSVDGRYYPLHSVTKLIDGLKTPAVDGGVVRRVVEGAIVPRLERMLPVPILPKRVFFCAAGLWAARRRSVGGPPAPRHPGSCAVAHPMPDGCDPTWITRTRDLRAMTAASREGGDSTLGT